MAYETIEQDSKNPDAGDKQFLSWLHQRLLNAHGEDEFAVHMHTLRRIIDEFEKPVPNPIEPIPEEGVRTTEEHFSIFKEECQYWIERFGIKGYQVYFMHSDRAPESFANYGASVVGRNATLCLTKKWTDEAIRAIGDITEEKIRQSAFHEVLELLLHRLWHIAENRAYTGSDFTEEKHNVIRIMENSVWSSDWERRKTQ